jgi:membrane protein
MNVAVLLVAVLVVIFVAVLVTGRRIGPLALAAAAGYIFVELWMETVRVILGGVGINLPWLPDGVVAALILLLVPMGMLMVSGPKYHKKHEKLVAAAVVTLLVAALLVGVLAKYLAVDGAAQTVVRQLTSWRQYIITAGLGVGLVDLFLLHTVKTKSKPGPKKH